MKLLECGVKDFRIIRDQRFKFTDGVNLIKGNNAQGKTTVLEAIYVFARGRSFRTRSEAEIIAFDKDGAEIDIVYEEIKCPRHTDGTRTESLLKTALR